MPGTSRSGGDWPPAADDGWGAATTVRGGSSRPPASGGSARSAASAGRTSTRDPRQAGGGARTTRSGADDGWSVGGPASRDQQRSNRANEKRTERSLRDLERHRAALAQPPERGLRAIVALIVVVVIAVLGGLIDTIGAIEIQGGFNIGIVVASVVGILIVKRSHMFPIVIAPPIVYTLGAGFQYYLKATSGNATKAKLDAAANYLVYGFPAIAAATAAVLIIAGIRLIARR